nr:MAG: ORF1 [Torque teno midi virus]
MPFWWKRRKRPWFYRRGTYQTRRRRRRFRRFRRRRPTRKPYRRRRRYQRRRKHKVRRKLKKIPITQWQPDSIVNCKIKGGGLLVLGAEGKQFACYTCSRTENTPAKVPAGGGFGVELYTLKYLYEEYRFHRNIWTKTNLYKDLCRYLKARITFYRHQNTDFIVTYERQPPFNIDEFTYPACHPFMMLQHKHKKIIKSALTKQNGRIKTSITIKPPKQMISKWFFTKDFCTANLFCLKASAANLNYAYIGGKHENDLATLISINIQFYILGDWAQTKTGTQIYKPYPNIALPVTYHYWDGRTDKQDTLHPKTYLESVNQETGFFKPTFLQAFKVANQAQIPCTYLRYNPNVDNGKGNKIWLCSALTSNYNPPSDPVLVSQGLPLWLAFYGWLDYIETMKHEDPGYLNSYYIMVQSPALFTLGGVSTQTSHILIDRTFFEGKAPYRGILSDTQKNYWYPLTLNQKESINTIVESGPYIPKYSQETYSSWELKYSYEFFFKWGGPQVSDPKVEDPQTQPTYPVPDKLSKKLQIQNPEKNIPETIIQAWDYRRGIIKESALKRIRDYQETDTDFQPDSETETPKKRQRLGPQLRHPLQKEEKIVHCLQELCKENTFQETEETSLKDLILQQQQQQYLIKRNLLELLSDLKHKQMLLQLQTGLFH